MNLFRHIKLLVVLILISAAFAHAQFDGRRMPRFLEADNYITANRNFYKPTKKHPDAMKEHSLPNLLGSKLKIVNMSGNINSQTETTIAINPANPNIIVGASNDSRYNNADSRYKMGAYYTSDAGLTWATSTTPGNMDADLIPYETNGGMTNFDPGIAFDSKGNCFYSFGYCQVPSGEAEGDNGVFVCRSTDGGATWDSPITVVREINGTANQPFHDRYSICTDLSSTSQYKDNIYLTWMKFYSNSAIAFSKSTDGGKSFSAYTVIPGKAANSQSPFPACGPNGELYVVWQNKATLTTTDVLFQKSTDGGATWLTSPKNIQNVNNVGIINSLSGRTVLYDKQSMRNSAYPQIAVDISNSSRRGHVYVVQAGKNEYYKTGIYLSKSSDGGSTWQSLQKIDANNINNDVFFPSISVDPVTGTVAVVYYSSQNDSANKGVDAYLAISTDGTTFKNWRLTENTWYLSNAMSVDNQGDGNYYYGDYTGVASYNGSIYPCFWMPNSSTGPFWTNNAYTVLVSDAPDAPSNLTAENDYKAPSKVVLKWLDPTLNLLGENLGDFKIVIYRGTSEIATVDKGVKQYTDNGAVDGEVFSYSIKARINSGKESEIITVTGVAGGGLEPDPPVNVSYRPLNDGITLYWKNPDKHTDSTYLHDFDKIEIYSSGTLLQSITKPNVQTGENSQIKLILDAGKFYELKLRAVSIRNGVENPGAFSDSIIAYAGKPKDYLEDNFDNSQVLNAWSNGGKGTWGIINTVAFSLPNCMTDSPTGKYTNNYDNEVRFAPVKIDQVNTVLNFRHIAIIDRNNDYGLLRVSSDFGTTWENLGWFNSDSSSEFTGDVTTSKWQFVSRNLSKYKGDTIIVSMIMHSNPITAKDGWYIDNLAINDGTAVLDELNDIFSKTMIVAEPNPVLNDLKLRIGLPATGNAQIEITDLFGRNLYTLDQGFKQAGEFSYNLSVESFSPGVYLIKVTVNGISVTKKFVKL